MRKIEFLKKETKFWKKSWFIKEFHDIHMTKSEPAIKEYHVINNSSDVSVWQQVELLKPQLENNILNRRSIRHNERESRFQFGYGNNKFFQTTVIIRKHKSSLWKIKDT